MIKCGIVGGTGYTGAELIRLLISHPETHIEVITSRSEAGTAVDAYFPNLRGRIEIGYTEPDPERLAACDVVFFATPNGTAMTMTPELVQRGVRVIDLAADFRLPDPNVWEQWYGMPHTCPHILEEAVYGLPEINRERIRSARVVANPGCYPTAVILGLLPLLERGLVDPEHLIADAKSGVSGAGRKASVPILLAECGESFKAYNVQGHRHWPEIKGVLEGVAARSLGFTFVPHLLPMIRGIHATLYATLTSEADLQALYEGRYADEPFVDVMPALSHPETRSVTGANLCRIAVHRPQDGPRVVVLSVIDNLVKGASGQAIQNMNLMFGLPEALGLDAIPVSP